MPHVKRVGLIGLGTITKNYVSGLHHAHDLELVAVCDLSPAAASAACYQVFPFYTNYLEMMDKEALDLVIISTTPSLHFEMAENALSRGIGVMMEKPATTNLSDYLTLSRLATERGLDLEVMYHWQTGSEVVEFGKRYDKAKISQICVDIRDDYCLNGIEIKEDKVNLGGAWLDSGVNALSMLKRWLPFDSVQIQYVSTEKCPRTNLPVYAHLIMSIDGVSVQIAVDWRHETNVKQTRMVYDGREIWLDHSGQRIVDGDTVIALDDMERLPRHYFNYFTTRGGRANTEESRRIHEILFEVNDAL